MKNTPLNARSLMGRAVLLLITAVFVVVSVIVISAETQETGYMRKNILRTSYNPECYSLFQIDGNTLTARGKYSSDRIRKIYLFGIEERSGSYKMKINTDGSYEAEISLPDGYRYTSVVIKLNSGAEFGYRMDCHNSWYFSDNGLSETNKKVFDNITDASPESVGYYLSPTADAEEIAVVLEQIKLISDSVTEGIENDYDKARALALYVAEHFYYDHDARATSVTEANVALSQVLKTSRTVCTGFADLYCALLQAQGIDTVNVKGGSTGGEITYEKLTDGVQNHEFTAFFYEAEQRWVWVDSCWNGSGDYQNGEYNEDNAHEKFFDISDEALALDHRADYAQRRDFFNAKPAEASETTENTVSETTPPETEAVSEETTTPTTENVTTTTDFPAEKKSDDTILIVITAVLGAGVVILAAFLAVRFIKGNKS